jgi:ribosome-associated protein
MNEIPDLTSECVFTTSRSSGTGGQHVNKTETKVELRFNIADSALLSATQKTTILNQIGTKLIDSGKSVSITVQVTRSQLKNKTIAIRKLHDVLADALQEDEPRIPTRPTKESVAKRKSLKKSVGLKKALRGNLKSRDLE